MKIILQRVNHAAVTVEGNTIAKITRGVLLLVGFGREDDTPINAEMEKLITKIINLRIFPNEQGKLDHSLLDINGAILAVPQFTLYGATAKGRRPDFTGALSPDLASRHFDSFVEMLRGTEIADIQCGKFGADMKVELENDGPFTLTLARHSG